MRKLYEDETLKLNIAEVWDEADEATRLDVLKKAIGVGSLFTFRGLEQLSKRVWKDIPRGVQLRLEKPLEHVKVADKVFEEAGMKKLVEKLERTQKVLGCLVEEDSGFLKRVSNIVAKALDDSFYSGFHYIDDGLIEIRGVKETIVVTIKKK
jgi:hypothetical protein